MTRKGIAAILGTDVPDRAEPEQLTRLRESPMAHRLKLVWNRDKPCYVLNVAGFSVTRSSVKECLQVAVAALERCLDLTKKQLKSEEPHAPK
jgi:hypothetical protein